MKAKIDAKLLAQLKPKSRPFEVYDEKLIGFVLRVQPSGAYSYVARYRLQGKQSRKSIARGLLGGACTHSPAQAREAARLILAGIIKGEDPHVRPVTHVTLGSFLEDHFGPWLAAHRKSGAATLKRLKACFIFFRGKKLEELTSFVLEKWRINRLKDVAASTVNRDIGALKAALSLAVEWEFIPANPLAGLKPAEEDGDPIVRFLSTDEEARLRAALDAREADARTERDNANRWRRERGYPEFPDLRSLAFVDRLQPQILLSLNTGLRQGELFGLQWPDVDLEHAMLTVRGSEAKSGKVRHIPLNSEAMKTLKAWRKQCAEDATLVFPGRTGKPVRDAKTAWASLLAKAEIANFRWHDMRHHFASRLVMAGVDLNTVRELLGHADIKMTLRYAHLAPEHKAAAVERLISKSKPKEK